MNSQHKHLTCLMLSASLISTVASGIIASDALSETKKNSTPNLSTKMIEINQGKLAASLNTRVLEAYPFQADGMMWLNGEPKRLRCSFGQDKLDNKTNYGERQIVLYPIGEFRKLYSGRDQLKEFDKRIMLMKTALAKNKCKSDEIAVFPSIDACQLFRSRIKFLDFKSGRGVRFLTSYATDVSPTTGNDVFYTFQGMSKDSKYWLSVFYPLKVSGLKESSDAKISERCLNSLDSGKFSPALEELDKMVQSIMIKY